MPLPQTDGVELPGWAKFLLVLAGGVAFSGLADFFATSAGYPLLGTYVWAAGYAGTIVVLWVVWLRPIDLEAPA